MPRGDKSAYTAKQKRQARDIEEGYEKRGVSEKESERRAWATVNKLSGGGLKKNATTTKRAAASKRTSATKAVAGRKSATKQGAGKKNATSKNAARKTARRSAGR